MYWYGWFIAALAILGIAFLDAIAVLFFRYKRKRIITPNRALILGTWGAACVLFYPLYLREIDSAASIAEYIQAGLVSIQHSIRIFAFDGGYMDIVRMVEGLDPEVQTLYTLLGSVLYLAAPILTVGIILSFFQNLTSYIYYIFSFWNHTHVFSELNERSLALAKSIDVVHNRKGQKRRYRFFKKALIVFTDVVNKNDEDNIELIEEAKEIGAVLFSKDLESIRYRKSYLSVRKLNFYLISEDEEEKLRHAESIMKEYDFPNVELRLFSDDIRSELLLASKKVKLMRAMRVNDIQSLIYHNLDVHGIRLFENARDITPSEKVISAVIVGFGKYGLEMTKALTWFCQLPGYRVKINVFDIDEKAEEKFTNICPELMSSKFNGQDIPGEAHYEINIHNGIDTNTPEFFDKMSQIKDATYIFVCLGNDEINLSTSVKIRSACERIHYTGDHHKPDIETVIYDSNIRNLMGMKWGEERSSSSESNNDGVTNFKKQHYNLHMIGDLDNFYSEKTFLDSDLIERGREINIRWAKENDPSSINNDKEKFDKYEYNYRSSISKAMHEKLRKDMYEKMGVDFPGIDMPRESILKDPNLCLKIGLIEHIRWNAYMRTEGYSYGTATDHLSKKHSCLVSVHKLEETENGREVLKKDV